MRARVTARRVGAVGLIATLGVAGLTAFWSVERSQRAAQRVIKARRLLGAPFQTAPTLMDLEARAAAKLLEEARALGHPESELTALTHYARAIAHLAEGALVFADRERASATEQHGWSADLRVLAGSIARREGDSDAARLQAERALARDSDHPRAKLLRADLALDRGNYRRALRDLRDLARSVPCAPVRNRLALALEAKGDLAGAQRQLERVASYGSEDPAPYINLGRLLRRQGSPERAVRAFDQAVSRASTRADAVLGRGLAQADLGRADAAERDIRRATELAPQHPLAHLALGDLLRGRGRVRAAIGAYRRAVGHADVDATGWLKLGNALVESGDFEQAAESFRGAIERAPRLAAAHNGLGAALMHLGQLPEAQRALAQAAELDRTDPNPLRNLALLHERNGNRRAARLAQRRLRALADLR